ncbi:right-handed parallel beta-helix repeat-containing protein [Mucilaginibacter sp. RS28]|uniref:Right-handed parallel beta-helix repeat-containing protein n=1 Tax=Mucilaginibacter straminoryzae TaxID=2932774 RepID=A0A9X2BA19_9SPHI|nr:right-handed parallel beta-helix repeat-containing protein [Mucilaginibacter straminoryzae]MCJ8211006.1 right-handed parallel beta-helix repeat-containing protein [Mucilaginibacter straminoryzae]
MKKLTVLKLTLYFCVTLVAVGTARASTYYVSETGNDNYNSLEARNPSTPWKTLDKVNAFFKSLNPGDSVLFKSGDTFNGQILASRSGSVFAPIYFGSYGRGAKPVVSGLDNLTNWKQLKNGIYETPCDFAPANLIINGVQQAMGRYPNKGYLSYEAHNGNNNITDNQLTNATNWEGAEVVIRKNRWIIDRSTITSQSNGTINFDGTSNATPTNGYGYFIQKDVRTLDQFGEWYYDASRKMMMVYFGSRNPGSFTVKADGVNHLVDIKRFNYLSFENIAFTGSAENAIHIIQAKNITLRDCDINYAGADAVFANYTPFVTVINCTINHALSGAIDLDAGCANSVVLNNQIRNTGLMAGMGKSGTGTYEAITSFGDNTRIERNRIDSTGYNGIYLGGNHATAKNNVISYFCLTKDDGGGIYVGDWSKTVNKKIINNIIVNGVGNTAGTNSSLMAAEGIYIDDNSESVTIVNNTVSLCANNGIKIHNAKDISILSNTVYNNGVQLRLEQDHYLATSSYIRNNTIRNNTFYSKNPVQSAAKFSTHQDDIASFGQLDSNFYCRKNEAGIVTASVKNGKGVNQRYNLVKWKTAYGKDQYSKETSTTEAVLFEYNDSGSARTVSLKQPYVDVHNRVYTDKVTIQPYSSVLLLASVKPVKNLEREQVLASR